MTLCSEHSAANTFRVGHGGMKSGYVVHSRLRHTCGYLPLTLTQVATTTVLDAQIQTSPRSIALRCGSNALPYVPVPGSSIRVRSRLPFHYRDRRLVDASEVQITRTCTCTQLHVGTSAAARVSPVFSLPLRAAEADDDDVGGFEGA